MPVSQYDTVDPEYWRAMARAEQTLSLLVHADSKTGKTTLAATSPKPMLLLDVEGGSKFLPYLKRSWDPMREPPPVWDGTWEICTVIVREYQTLSMVYQWLVSGSHPFVSVAMDSISESQRRCKENLVGTEAMKMQDWGTLLTRMDGIIRGYRDLTLHPTNPLASVVFIAETRLGNGGKWKPYMQGQIDVALPYWMDLIGYLYVSQEPDVNDPLKTTPTRVLLISPNPQFEAGERVQGVLGPAVVKPDVSEMLVTTYQRLAQLAGGQ